MSKDKPTYDELKKLLREKDKLITELEEEVKKTKIFAYSVVHDLRSPTTGIGGLAKLLKEHYEDVLNTRGIATVKNLERIAQHIEELIRKINVFIEARELPLEITNLNLVETIKFLDDEFQSRLAVRKVKMVVPKDLPTIRADRLNVLRIFRNLIDNALKYAGEELSSITIDYDHDKKFHQFSVSDDGKGIKVENSEIIFRQFVSKKSTNGVVGSGLGLAIVREIVEQHGGKVWAEPGEEKGTTFYFTVSKKL